MHPIFLDTGWLNLYNYIKVFYKGGVIRMQKRTIIKLISFLLTMLQLIFFYACADGSGKITDTSESTSTGKSQSLGNSEIIQLLNEDGNPKYSIVRPENAGKSLVSATADLRKTLSLATGKEFRIFSDWVKNEAEIDNKSCEILIGRTNRTASVAAFEGMSIGDYIITVSGNKIVICGGSDSATIAALKYFTENCLSLDDGVGVSIASTVEYKKDYPGKNFTIAGIPIGEYAIVYSAAVEDEEGITIANQLNEFIADVCGISLDVRKDTEAETDNEILIGRANRAVSAALYKNGFGTYDYKIAQSGKKLLIGGGSCFALYYGIKLLKENYMAKNIQITDGITQAGSMYGEYLYEREKGAEIRIMSNNVWDCDNNAPAWSAIGEDCSAKVRSVGLAAVYMAYLPDVICFQEMSIAMIARIRDEISKYGYSYSLLSFTAGSDADNTCILYRTDTVELKDKGRHEYTYGNNGGSKSYTWGYFVLKSTGEDFIALSTHLWYKSESEQAGSNKWREDQAGEIVARTTSLISKYNCPVFAMGDFNTTTASEAFKVFINGGFSDTYDLASVFADNHCGRHSCSPEGFSRETSAGTYAGNAIDHILLRNAGETKILVFNHVRPYFYIKLSDHYPVYVDALLS
jgi:exonuclease III